LHQEDYCQALGKPPTAKYESNQTGICGPTLKEMFELTRRHMFPNDTLLLLDLIIFNVLACNTDAHAKNYSIMLRGNGASLAPLYDVMCGEVWENVTKNMVHKIGGATRADHLTGRHWQKFASECGLNPRQVLDRVASLAKLAVIEAGMAESEVAAMPAAAEHPILYQTRQLIERRARALLSELQEVGDSAVGESG
jgi:serine/threonine-protein kinase HipA